MKARELIIGQTIRHQSGTSCQITAITHLDGGDGRCPELIGGNGFKSAVALELTFSNGDKGIVHPAAEVDLAQ